MSRGCLLQLEVNLHITIVHLLSNRGAICIVEVVRSRKHNYAGHAPKYAGSAPRARWEVPHTRMNCTVPPAVSSSKIQFFNPLHIFDKANSACYDTPKPITCRTNLSVEYVALRK
jgi:hypothetical protein